MRALEILGFCAGRIYYREDEKYIFLKKILHIILKPVGRRFFSSRMNKLAQKCSYKKSKYAGVWIDTGYGQREIMDKEIFEKSIQMIFNGIELSVPAAFDQYLVNLFGDYMSVPEDAVENSYKILDGWEMMFDKE